jgi:hypothetical protein
MKITFYAHASFRLETPEVSIVTDPYTPGVSGFEPIDEPADIVIMSSATDRFHSDASHIRGDPMRDCAYSLSKLDVDAAKDKKERAHRERNLRRLHAIIVREARRYAPAKVLVVTQLRVKKRLQALGMIPGNVVWGHHNGVRGVDRWRDVRFLIVVGRTLPPSNATARAAEALTGVAATSRDYEKRAAFREMADGRIATVEAGHSRDPTAEGFRWQSCVVGSDRCIASRCRPRNCAPC